ncbi:LPXTG cell wall anchor domain-containing protein, partial [Listeria monocytogenes]|nr:LPXTG cell wall anchor domain-containing protein [Listeria monocytogenes]
ADNNDTTPEVAGESQTGKDNTITSPEVTEPEVTEPEVTEPEVTEPEVTEPEVTKPEVTEPVKKTPETKDKKQAAKPRAVETIEDIFPDRNFAIFIAKELGKNSPSDVVTQAELDTIQEVYGGMSGVQSIEGVERLTRLIILNAGAKANPGNKISDLSPLSARMNLEVLAIDDQNVSDLSPLSGLVNLVHLQLDGNKISDLSPLSGLVNLDVVNVSRNKISDLSPLSGAKNITSLEAFNQEISLPEVNWSNPLSITNSIKDENGNIVAPSITSGQVYSGGKVVWNNLSKSDQTITYNWGTSQFSGKVTIPVKMAYKDLVFDNDGNKKTQTVLVNDVVKEPTTPTSTKQGYVFTGWYDARSGGTKWDFATDKMPDKDMTLYAQYSKQSYKVIFDNAGNKNEKSVQFETLVKEPTAPTKQGYTFTGWYDAETGGTKWDFKNDKMPASDLTLYARYEKNPDESTPVVTPPTNITNSNSQETTIVNEGSNWNDGLPKTGDVLSIGLPILGAGLLVLVGVWTLKKRKKSKM